MTSTQVIPVNTAITALKSSPKTFLKIVKKGTGVQKEYKGASFYDIKLTAGDKYKNVEGWINIGEYDVLKKINAPDGTQTTELVKCGTPIDITGMADPQDSADPRNREVSMREQISTTVSKSGTTGEFLSLLDPVWHESADQFVKSGAIILGDKRHIKELLQTKISIDAKTNGGQAIDDPIIRFKVAFGNYPAKHPNATLRNTPKFVLLDGRTEYVENNVRKYKPAVLLEEREDGTVEEVPIDTNNVHKFITSGSKLLRGRISMTSACRSATCLSLPMMITRAVIIPGASGTFSDDQPYEENEIDAVAQALQSAHIATPAFPVSPTSSPTSTSTQSTPAPEPEVVSVLPTEPASVPPPAVSTEESVVEIF